MPRSPNAPARSSRRWSFPVALEGQPGAARTPLFAQIASAIAADIGRGRLRPGDRLPGTRSLAATLSVHRSTVVAAYQELAAQGWTDTRPAGATLVAASSPDVHFRPGGAGVGEPRAGVPRRPGFELAPAAWRYPPRAPAPLPAGALALWGGVPDLRLVPVDLLGRALRRVTRGRGRQLLAYSADRRGHPHLRAELARMLTATRGLAATADDVLVTQGSQMALALLARAVLAAGDVVAVEALGYPPAWSAFQAHGARLLPVPVDEQGLDTDALAALAARTRLRAVYLTPQHHYPTTAVLPPRRRAALLALARSHGLLVIEDDYDHEFHYEGRPVLPLAAADRDGLVAYVGTLAKILAPGLRVGFVVAPPPLLARMVDERMFLDRQGVPVVEAAVAELLEDGEVARHARRARRLYQRRRDVLVAALGRQLGSALSFTVPAGGMALWARAAPGIDVARWQTRAQAAGLLFQVGAEFSFDGRPLPCLRLGYALCDERELETAARRLAATAPARAR
jgi:GntR family transcriptional regulator / MocR family aminotransferase